MCFYAFGCDVVTGELMYVYPSPHLQPKCSVFNTQYTMEKGEIVQWEIKFLLWSSARPPRCTYNLPNGLLACFQLRRERAHRGINYEWRKAKPLDEASPALCVVQLLVSSIVFNMREM